MYQNIILKNTAQENVVLRYLMRNIGVSLSPKRIQVNSSVGQNMQVEL
jgi:hypothetical protein